MFMNHFFFVFYVFFVLGVVLNQAEPITVAKDLAIIDNNNQTWYFCEKKTWGPKELQVARNRS